MGTRPLTIFISVLLFSLSGYAKSSRRWVKATVDGTHSESYETGTAIAPIGNALYKIPLRGHVTYYYIETQDTKYILIWANKSHPLNVTIHGNTEICLDSNGKDAHILDDSGKDIKLPIAEKTAKEP